MMNPLRLFCLLLSVTLTCVPASAAVRYVNANAAGPGTGLSWTNAYKEIQPAIDDCAPGDEVWIATGIYYPDYRTTTQTHTGTRTQRLTLKSNISIYGGFAGFETARAQRDWVVRRTIISGDIGQPGVFSDNTRTIMAGASVTGVVIEGIVFAGGNANDPAEGGNGIVGGSGGIAHLTSSVVEFRYCAFLGSYAVYGGALDTEANTGSNLSVVNCLFAGNSAQFVGGAINFHSYTGQFTVRNCTIVNNSSSRGAAIGTNSMPQCSYFNNLIHSNPATSQGWKKVETGNGTTLTAENNVLEEALVPAGTNNAVTANAGFAQMPSPGNDGRWGTMDDVLVATILPTSPAHDLAATNRLALDTTDLDGDANTTETAPFDLLRTPRIQNGTADAGAFEVDDGATLPPSLTQPAPGSFVSTVSVAFTLPEPALANSVTLTFSDGSTDRTLTLTSAQEGQGTHTFTFSPANPLAATTAIAAGSTIPDGVYAVTLSYRDAAGHPVATSAVQANVTIDTVAPYLPIPNPTPVVEATGPDGAVVHFQAVPLDPRIQTSVSPPSGSTFPVGQTTVNVSATDTAGNQATASFLVKVRDTKPPTVSSLAAQRLVAGATGVVVLPDYRGSLVASDIVGVTEKTQAPAPGAILPLGTHTLSFVVKDGAGNQTPTQTSVLVEFERTGIVASSIATPGDQAPGAGQPDGPPPGAVLAQVFTPAISDFRDLVARATVVAGRKRLGAIYREDGAGASSILALQGMPAPGIDGATFASFSDPLVAPDGSVAFSARVKGGGGADTGVWTTVFDGSLKLALRESSPVPGLKKEIVLHTVQSVSIRDGELLALVTLRGAVTPRNDKALVRLTSPAVGRVLLREGFAPGWAGGDSPITAMSVLAPALGSPGHGRSHADGAITARITLADGRVAIVTTTADGVVHPRIVTGDLAPEVAPGALWAELSPPAVSSDGAFLTSLAALRPGKGGVTSRDASTLVRIGSDGLDIVARDGDFAPGTDSAFFTRFLDPVVNRSGNVAFLANTQRQGRTVANPLGLWHLADSRVEEVALPGGMAPDADGVPTTSKWDRVLSAALPDELAGPLFIAKLVGPGVTPANNQGLWAVDSKGLLRRLLRTGAETHAGGVTRVISDFKLLTALPPGPGATRSFNATGSVALLATFTDRTQALLRIDVP